MGIFDMIRRANPAPSAPVRVSAEAEFWTWFAGNASLWRDIGHDTERVMDDILLRLDRVDSALAFDFGPERDGRREVVVTANGDPLAFPSVVRLVAAAPPLERWTVTAFRQRREARGCFALHCGGAVCLEEVRFVAEPAGDRVELDLFVPGYRRRFADEYEIVGHLLLDMVLGEFDALTRIGGVSVGPPQPAVKSRPLAELAALVDALPAN
jgi:hypothetical protein